MENERRRSASGINTLKKKTWNQGDEREREREREREAFSFESDFKTTSPQG